MVAICVRTLGQQPVECNARPLLFAAHASLERNEVIAAGVHLREAIRLFLRAQCEYHGITLPKKERRITPGSMMRALEKAGHLEEFGREWLEEIVGYCNSLAHCGFVRASLIGGCIGVVHSFLDGSPYLIQPTAAGRLS